MAQIIPFPTCTVSDDPWYTPPELDDQDVSAIVDFSMMLATQILRHDGSASPAADEAHDAACAKAFQLLVTIAPRLRAIVATAVGVEAREG